MKLWPLTPLLAALYVLPAFAGPNQVSWSFDHSDAVSAVFKADGKGLKSIHVTWADPSLLGELKTDDPSPSYFLFAAKNCGTAGNAECSERSLYLVRPQDGEKPYSFVYPGRIIDPHGHGVMYESRGFFGKCVAGRGEVYVVFQKESVDRRHRAQSSVFVAEARDPHLQEILLEKQLPRLSDTVRLVKRKLCKEIPGRNRMAATRRLSLPVDDDDDSDLNDEKESDD